MSTTECQFEQEIRLAIVMYGGISLAIYMNGITQELYHLVRAKASKCRLWYVDIVKPKFVRALMLATDKIKCGSKRKNPLHFYSE